MASSFPGAIDSFVDPLSTSPLSSPSHALQHQNINDAVEKVETYMGLVKVIPTSVTGGTLGATGTIAVGTGVTSVTVNGAFSSLYDNYKITMSGGTKSVDGALSLTLSGQTTGYYLSYIYGSYTGTTVTNFGGNNVSTWTDVAGGYSNAAVVNLELFAPFLPVATAGFAWVRYSTFWGTANLLNVNMVSSTGFTLIVPSGTISGGNIRVYGYRN